MDQTRTYIGIFIFFFILMGCDGDEPGIKNLPAIVIKPVSVLESDFSPDLLPYSIQLEKAFAEDLVLHCSTRKLTALPAEDYTELNDESLILNAGETDIIIPIPILGDTLMEFTEQFEITVHYEFHGIRQSSRAIITIENDDFIHPVLNQDGFDISLQYPGMWLFWHDEFDQETIHDDYWNYDAPNAFPMNCGGGDEEISRYTGDTDHLKIRDGKLILSATFDPLTGIYRTSRVNTKEKVNIRYGRIDFRAKLAPGAGMATSLLMLGKEGEWPAGGEIDVLKMAGKDDESVCCSLVYEEESVRILEKKSSLTDPIFNLTDYFHIYTLLWEEDRITWLMDYKPYFTVTRETFPDDYIFNNFFFFKINLAVGGNFAGLPESSTEFPSELVIDYVRVYQPVEFQNYD